MVPNKGEQNHKWLPHPCLLGGPKEGGNATSPLHSRGSPKKGSKIRSGPQQRGTKSELAASPLPSRGPKGGRKCYVTLAFSGSNGFKKGVLTGPVEKSPSRGSSMVQSNPTTNVPKREKKEGLRERPVSCTVPMGSIMVGHRYWMPPLRQFQPMFQVSISNRLLCYIQSV